MPNRVHAAEGQPGGGWLWLCGGCRQARHSSLCSCAVGQARACAHAAHSLRCNHSLRGSLLLPVTPPPTPSTASSLSALPFRFCSTLLPLLLLLAARGGLGCPQPTEFVMIGSGYTSTAPHQAARLGSLAVCCVRGNPEGDFSKNDQECVSKLCFVVFQTQFAGCLSSHSVYCVGMTLFQWFGVKHGPLRPKNKSHFVTSRHHYHRTCPPRPSIHAWVLLLPLLLRLLLLLLFQQALFLPPRTRGGQGSAARGALCTSSTLDLRATVAWAGDGDHE